MGEGSGMLVLESLEHAEKRGATILAEVVGYGNTCDAYHMTSPHPEGQGAIKAIKLALEEAEITPDQVAYVNAHGTSTPANEKGESGAIVAVLGKEVPVSSTKSFTGHLLGAAGAVEAIATIEAIRNNYVPMTAGTTECQTTLKQTLFMDKAWNMKFLMLSQILLDLVGIMQFLLSNVGRISKNEFK